MVTTKKLMALAAVGALMLAACGSDDDTADTGDTAPAQTDAPEATDAPDATDALTPPMRRSRRTLPRPPPTEARLRCGIRRRCRSVRRSRRGHRADRRVVEDRHVASPLGWPSGAVRSLADGQQAYIDYYNTEFGGIDGQPIELVIKDDQYQADLTKANVDELIFDEQVDMLSGIVGTPNNLAIRDDHERPVHPAAGRGDRRARVG